MSIRSLTRRFREQTGTTPLQWLIRARVRRAQLLLETTAHSVERIATDARLRLRHGAARALPPPRRDEPARVSARVSELAFVREFHWFRAAARG